MDTLEQLFDEFAHEIETANTIAEFQDVGTRLARRLGFRWFAYLNRLQDTPLILSSYPQAWIRRYVEHGYERVDPVVRRSARERRLFSWDVQKPGTNREQRRFFGYASAFGIKSGITLPIKGRLGSTIAFTLAHDQAISSSSKPTCELLETVQLIGVYFHAHAAARLNAWRSIRLTKTEELTQRERQCLAWIAQGKTVREAGMLIGISARTVAFHLDNARKKLGAVSIAQCVGEAVRRQLLS